MSEYNSMITLDAWFDWYDEPDNSEEWYECPHCNSKPRIWEFDNGRFAQCRCSVDYSKYNKRTIVAESIGELLRRTGGDATDYDECALQKAWNNYVEGEK